MPKVTIDGREIAVDSGTTILQAAERLGIFVPHYCYHRRLAIAGNCRMCLVEVEKQPKLVTSCTFPIERDGLVVHTTSPRVKEAQAAVLEFLLLNHPLDCPICDKAGECLLQDYYFEYSGRDTRLGVDEKVHKPKNVDLGRHIVLDAERCILCTRCVRFMRDVARDPVLGIALRGDRSEITVAPSRRLDSRYSINTTDICPVGALTSKPFRFAQRVWFLSHTRSVCPHCSAGCPVVLDHKRRTIHRMMPDGPGGTDTWLCDPGRLGYTFANDPGRPRRPLEATSDARGAHAPIAWDEALGKLATAIRDYQAKGGPGGVAAVVSNWCTNEEILAVSRIFRALGSTSVALSRPLAGLVDSGPPDDILVEEDKNPNTRGLDEISRAVKPPFKPLSEILQGVAAGAVRMLIVLDPDLLGRLPEGKERKKAADALRKARYVAVVSPIASDTSRLAHLHLPSATWAEKEGSFTSSKGLVRKIRPAFPSPSGYTDLAILRDLARALDLKIAPLEPAAVFADLSASVPPFKGLAWADLERAASQLKPAEPPTGPQRK